jgi:hypothetical protein
VNSGRSLIRSPDNANQFPLLDAVMRRETLGRAPGSLMAIVILLSLLLASCSDANPSRLASTSAPTSSPVIPPPLTTTTTTVPIEPGWTPIATGPNGVITDQRNVTVPDGHQITVVRFRAGQVRFNLHAGSQDPPTGTAVIGPESSSLVGTTEIPELLGAFNGGFKVNAAAGGVEVDGQTLTPLLNGLASFVIDTNGTGRIGVWGSTVPILGEQVASVRQNLPPLIEGGQMSAQITNVTQWGATLHGLTATARSALGEDPAGDILFAASMSALPVDLALALSDDGAIDAMELDINPAWIQLDLASTAGGPLVTAIPGQSRPANQYLVGWTRDFITVLTSAPILQAGVGSA